jgi:enoyl-CoA hydratase/carnithine racemase
VAQDDPRIKIGLNEVALGLRFPPAILRIVRARVPHRHIETIVLGAGLHPPRTAQQMGLVDEVADDAVAVARQRLLTLASYPPDAYAANKADLRGELGSTPEEERRFLVDVLPSWTSDALRARIAGLLAR